MLRNTFSSTWLLASLLTLGATYSHALTELSDDSLSDVQGAGLAFALDDFRFQAAPTSYIEQIGGLPDPSTSFERGDLRWFGVTFSNWSATETGADTTTWSGTCGSGIRDLGCPISNAGIANYANPGNPFLLRVFEYQRVGLDPNASTVNGDWLGDPVSGGVSPNGVSRTVLELLGPSDSQDWRWAFWGEIQTSLTDSNGNITSVIGKLRNQNLIIGKPAAFVKPPSIFGTNTATNPVDGAVLRLFQYRGDRVDGGGNPFLDETLGLSYISRLSGDYRFSVNQKSGSLDSDLVPEFTNQEGLYFKDVNAYLPLGAMYYQAIVLDSVNPGGGAPGDGNFIIDLTRIPNDLQAYSDFYSINGSYADVESGYNRIGRNDRYYQTHGYVEWGGYFPSCSGGTNCIPGSGSNDGIRFSGPGYSGTGQSITLPERVINATNFPGPICGNGQDEACSQYQGVAAEVTVPLSSGPIAATSSRAAVGNAGGIAFVSRNASSTWWVQNNQNDGFLERDPAVVRWRTDGYNYDCFLGVFDCSYGVRANSPNPPTSTAPAVLRNQSPFVEVNAINLGSSRVEGLLVQSLKITSLGAAN